jgi:hypothetical protein
MRVLFSTILVLLLSASAFAEQESAIEYNDKIITEQTKIGAAIITFSTTPNDFSLSNVRNQVDKSLDILNGMKPYEGNKTFLSSAKTLFKFYAGVSNKEYRKILQLLENRQKFTPEKLTHTINQLIESIAKKEDPLDKALQAQQAAFATKYGFQLQKVKSINQSATYIDEDK